MNEQWIGCKQTFLMLILAWIYMHVYLHVFHKIGALESSAKFSGQHLYWGPFSVKLEAFRLELLGVLQILQNI